jgi:hypothetical protein
VQNARIAQIVSTPPPGGNSPEMPTGDRYRIQPQILATGATPRRLTFQSANLSAADEFDTPRLESRSLPIRISIRNHFWPVSPFVLAFVPGTTRSTPTGRDCLAANTAQAHARLSPYAISASTQAPLPDFRFSITCPTKGTHRRPSRRLKPFLR